MPFEIKHIILMTFGGKSEYLNKLFIIKILITGGGGYIGSELAFVLNHIDKVEEITMHDNLSRKGHVFSWR